MQLVKHWKYWQLKKRCTGSMKRFASNPQFKISPSCLWNNAEVWMMIMQQWWWWFRVFATTMGYEWWSTMMMIDDHERNGDNEDFLQEISGVRSRTLCRAPPPRVKRILDDDQHTRVIIRVKHIFPGPADDVGWLSASLWDDDQRVKRLTMIVIWPCWPGSSSLYDDDQNPCLMMISIIVGSWSVHCKKDGHQKNLDDRHTLLKRSTFSFKNVMMAIITESQWL